jgi:hypothetical protein
VEPGRLAHPRLLHFEHHVGPAEEADGVGHDLRPGADELIVGPQGPFAGRSLDQHLETHRNVLPDRFGNRGNPTLLFEDLFGNSKDHTRPPQRSLASHPAHLGAAMTA